MCTLSLCFFPKKISVIIPALAVIEEHYYGPEHFQRWKDYVLQFCEKLHSEDIKEKFYNNPLRYIGFDEMITLPAVIQPQTNPGDTKIAKGLNGEQIIIQPQPGTWYINMVNPKEDARDYFRFAFLDYWKSRRKDIKVLPGRGDLWSVLGVNAWDYFVENKLNDIDKLVPSYIDRFYRSNQSFRGWNFQNITYQDHICLQFVQFILRNIAQDFVPKSC